MIFHVVWWCGRGQGFSYCASPWKPILLAWIQYCFLSADFLLNMFHDVANVFYRFLWHSSKNEQVWNMRGKNCGIKLLFVVHIAPISLSPFVFIFARFRAITLSPLYTASGQLRSSRFRSFAEILLSFHLIIDYWLRSNWWWPPPLLVSPFSFDFVLSLFALTEQCQKMPTDNLPCSTVSEWETIHDLGTDSLELEIASQLANYFRDAGDTGCVIWLDFCFRDFFADCPPC